MPDKPGHDAPRPPVCDELDRPNHSVQAAGFRGCGVGRGDPARRLLGALPRAVRSYGAGAGIGLSARAVSMARTDPAASGCDWSRTECDAARDDGTER